MRAIVHLIFLSIILSIVSCEQAPKDDLAYKRIVYEALKKSNQDEEESIGQIYQNLDNKKHDYKTKWKAIIWSPKADSVYIKSEDIVKSINVIENLLLKGFEKCNSAEGSQNDECVDAFFKRGYNSKAIIIGQKRLEHLFGQYSILISDIGKLMPLEFEDNPKLHTMVKEDMVIFQRTFALTKSPKEYVCIYSKREMLDQLTLLETYKFNVLHLEKKMIEYIDSYICAFTCGYDSYQAIATINKDVVLPGEEVEIYAGVGSFSEAALPEISINASHIKLEDGMATYKFKAENKVGTHAIPLQIKFTKPDGTPAILTKNIIYYTVDSICR